jgi:hypothetical protein
MGGGDSLAVPSIPHDDSRGVGGMYTMAVNHDVEDYDRWKTVFDEYPPSVGKAKFHRINRNVDNPNNITVIAGFETLDAALGFRDNPDLKDAMGRAGVTSAPRIEIYEEVENVQY